MRRASLALALAALVAAVSAPAPAAPGAGPPVVRVAADDPLAIRGLRFHARERVKVSAVVFGRGRAVRTVTATTTGTFLVEFERLEVGECDAYVIRAVGSRGSSARFRQPLPPCGAAP